MKCQLSIAVISILFCLIITSNALSLYSPDDPLHELDNSNFESVVFNKENAWIIEFYNNWCGHCIRYAPQWKKFARDIRTWRNVVDIAVVNCADAHNLKICRDHGIEGYPTIQVFKPYVNASTKGEKFNGNRDIESIGSSLADFLELSQDENAPNDWPDLHPLALSSVGEVTNLLKPNEESIILVFEHSDSSIGKKIILDLSFQSSDVIRRVLMTNSDLLTNLKTDISNDTLITVLKLEKSGKEEVLFSFPADTNATYIRNQVFLYIVGTPRGDSEKLVGSKSNSNINVSIKDSVQMTDLENALHYMLYQEVAVVKHLYGNRLVALQDILLMLQNYFPGKAHVKAYIYKVNTWLIKQKNITGEEFVLKLDSLQTSNEYLPEMKDFVSCKGSEPRYRGYPCSLWTLFHTLTVSAYILDEETAGAKNEQVMTVLPNIKNYIKYFFTCEECVQNFQKMDQNIERDDSTSGNAVLFLWSAHNKVNERLSGDVTEDPQHPKVQFPPVDMCLNCRLSSKSPDSIKWDEVQVLRFLRHFYGKQNIIGSDENQQQGSYTSGNSSMDLKFGRFMIMNLLLWFLRYFVRKLDSDQD